MLSDKGYEILQLILVDRTNDILDFSTYHHLEDSKYIDYDGMAHAYVTPLGEEACKEYELNKATKESAEEANRIAAKASMKSTIANILAGISVIISIIGLILSCFL